MDITQIESLLRVVLTVGAAGIISSITGVILIVRAGKMVSREVKGADLDNRGKEMDIVSQYDEIANKAAEKALNWQERFNELDEKYNDIKAENREIKEKLEAQDAVIAAQAKKITKLVCELNNSKEYINALIKQMHEAEITPISMSSLELQNCEDPQPKKKKSRMEDKYAPS